MSTDAPTPSSGFRQRVLSLVAQIPSGRVMTFGQIAAICGSPRAARIVGGIAHTGDPLLPWQRVVNAQGGTATGYPGGTATQQKHLEEEGISFRNNHLKLEEYRWNPK